MCLLREMKVARMPESNGTRGWNLQARLMVSRLPSPTRCPKARLITISGGGEGGAPDATAGNITSVIQTVLAAQLVAKGGLLDGGDGADDGSRRIAVPAFTGTVPRVGG